MENNSYKYLLEKYRKDWVFFVEHALGHKTWSKQREIIRAIQDNNKVAVKACHGSSKTFTAAEAAVTFLNIYPKSKVITTAPTYKQVHDLLWTEVRSIYLKSRIQLIGNCNQDRINTDNPDHFALGFSTDKQEKAEGYHAQDIMFIFDEAKGIPGWMWDAAKGALTSGNWKWLVMSTTDGVSIGENFYRVFDDNDKYAEGWKRISISAYESPYLTGEKLQGIELIDGRFDTYKKCEYDINKIGIAIASQTYIDEALKDWGQDSPLFLTKVKGEIINNMSDGIISLVDVLKMESNNNINQDFVGAIEIGADIARYGDDRTVIFKRKGMRIVAHRIESKIDTVRTSGIIEEMADYDKHIRIKIDDTGVGGGVTDILKNKGYNVYPINFGGNAIEDDKYANIISEMWYTVPIKQIACPKMDLLIIELVNRKGKMDKRGRRVVESKDEYKKRGFRSPDVADAFLLTFYKPKNKINVVQVISGLRSRL